jgi:hypothetical protein
LDIGFREGDEGIFLEQAENPLVEDQPLIEAERWGLGAAGAAGGGGGGHTV